LQKSVGPPISFPLQNSVWACDGPFNYEALFLILLASLRTATALPCLHFFKGIRPPFLLFFWRVGPLVAVPDSALGHPFFAPFPISPCVMDLQPFSPVSPVFTKPVHLPLCLFFPILPYTTIVRAVTPIFAFFFGGWDVHSPFPPLHFAKFFCLPFLRFVPNQVSPYPAFLHPLVNFDFFF